MLKKVINFKISITTKIILIYIFLLLSTVILTSITGYYFFQKFIDNKMSIMKIDTNVMKLKLEEMYEKKVNLFEIPEIRNKPDDKKNTTDFFKETIKKYYPNYNFKVETIEGTIKFKEEPKLIYDNKEKKYFVEITRYISFNEKLPFKSLKLSVKLNFFQIILKSLFFGTLTTVLFLFPVIILFSKTIINPIINISKGARQIANGNLGIEVITKSRDELGELASSFNYMSKELSKMKIIRDDLLAVISHELRSPLGRIKGYAELLDDLKLSKKEKEIYFKSIFNEIDFLNYMAGEIIEISRLELKKERLFIEKIDLADLLSTLKEELDIIQTIKSDVKYNFIYEKEMFCKIDIEKIKRVFMNAIENSIKAESSEISVIANKKNNKIDISIIDNGKGIPADQLELVFEKFYRVDKSRDRKTGGFGLGLAICKGIIKEHKGDIFFNKKDRGAELHIEIPSA